MTLKLEFHSNRNVTPIGILIIECHSNLNVTKIGRLNKANAISAKLLVLKGHKGLFIVCSKVVLFMFKTGFLKIFIASIFLFDANFQN